MPNKQSIDCRFFAGGKLPIHSYVSKMVTRSWCLCFTAAQCCSEPHLQPQVVAVEEALLSSHRYRLCLALGLCLWDGPMNGEHSCRKHQIDHGSVQSVQRGAGEFGDF